MSTRRLSSRRTPAATAVIWLACALITISQWVGLIHGQVHALDAPHQVAAESTDGDPWSGHEEGSAECRLLDQLAHAGLLDVAAGDSRPAPAVAQPVPTQQERHPGGERRARPWARGPPLIVA